MFVIYHIKSTVQVGPAAGGAPHSLYAVTYKTAYRALKACARMNNLTLGTHTYGPGNYAVAHVDHYHNHVVKQVTRVNLMSGQEYQEASNTPLYLSPASETYWSS